MSKFTDNIIIGAAVMALVDESYRVELCDQDGGGLYLYAALDGGEIPTTGADYWIRFTTDNDSASDCITDYSTNLETILAPVLALAESLG